MAASPSPRFYAVVPAAGIGRRMGADIPKQYLPLAGQSVLECTLGRLLAFDAFTHIVVAVAENDHQWPRLDIARHPKIITVPGGAERSDSVLNGLQHLQQIADATDWVLVHDVARPCITHRELTQLISTLREDEVGGILAVPVSDTVKRVQQHTIHDTLDRRELWRAQTPQMFRLKALRDALVFAQQQSLPITDEASALELQGKQPKIVEGFASNIKVTRPEDLALAAFYWLQQQQENSSL